MIRKFFTCIGITCGLLLNGPAMSDDFGEDFDPFSDTAINLDALSLPPATEPYIFSGELKLDLGYSPQRLGSDWSKLQISSLLKLDADIDEQTHLRLSWQGYYDAAYEHLGRSSFDDETLDSYETDSELHEGYISRRLGDHSRLKIGRQIIVWSMAELARVTDVVTPLDQRELGMKSIGDQRLSATAAMLSSNFGAWQYDLVILPEVRTDELPTRDSGLDPYVLVRGPGVRIQNEEVPNTSLDNTEFAARILYSFHGGDLSLIAADMFDDTAYLNFSGLDAGTILLTPKHRRVFNIGLAGNVVSGSWLYKFELLRQHGKAIQRNDLRAQILSGVPNPTSFSERNLLKGLIGLEYSGFNDTSVILEYFGETIEEHDSTLAQDLFDHNLGLYISNQAFNETFSSTLTWIHNLRHGGGDLLRLNLDYKIDDNIEVGTAYVLWSADETENSLYPYRKNDRINFTFTYRF
ncbi:DUF1302 family protein [Pseudomonadota bacterium]